MADTTPTENTTTASPVIERVRRGPEPLIDKPMLSEFLKEEGNKNLTRSVATLKAGAAYEIGMLVAKDGDKWKQANASSTAAGVVIYAADATDGDQISTIIVRGPAAVSSGGIIYAADVDTAAKQLSKRNQLAETGIVVLETA